MRKPKTTSEPAAAQALTLADIVIIWHDGKQEHHIEGEHVALALALAYRQISNGMGDWEIFTDQNDAICRLRGIEQILANTVDGGGGVIEDDWHWAVKELVRDVRICCELAAHPVKAAEYRIQVGKLEKTRRLVIQEAAKAA